MKRQLSELSSMSFLNPDCELGDRYSPSSMKTIFCLLGNKETVEQAALEYLEKIKSPALNTSWQQFDIDIFKAGAEWQKEQLANDAVPTEEEIQKKANINADKYLKRFDTIAVFVGYNDGYKQALKDLGYE